MLILATHHGARIFSLLKQIEAADALTRSSLSLSCVVFSSLHTRLYDKKKSLLRKIFFLLYLNFEKIVENQYAAAVAVKIARIMYRTGERQKERERKIKKYTGREKE